MEAREETMLKIGFIFKCDFLEPHELLSNEGQSLMLNICIHFCRIRSGLFENTANSVLGKLCYLFFMCKLEIKWKGQAKYFLYGISGT